MFSQSNDLIKYDIDFLQITLILINHGCQSSKLEQLNNGPEINKYVVMSWPPQFYYTKDYDYFVSFPICARRSLNHAKRKWLCIS